MGGYRRLASRGCLLLESHSQRGWTLNSQGVRIAWSKGWGGNKRVLNNVYLCALW